MPSLSSYDNVAPQGEGEEDVVDDSNHLELETTTSLARMSTLKNFVLMAVLFSANHGCTASALALAVSRLGSHGSLSSGVLFLSYALSSVLGATYATEKLGARGAMMSGMGLYCVYILCFVVATARPSLEVASCVVGALAGGIGGGFLWTAQGAYFAISSELYAKDADSLAASSSFLGGLFAFIYLGLEISLKVLSTVMVRLWYSWETVYGVYSFIAILSTVATMCIHDLKKTSSPGETTSVNSTDDDDNMETRSTFLYKISAAVRLLMTDPKMKYMIGLNASFGFSSSFLNSYVSGSVETTALNDVKSEYIGVLSATTACTAAVFSLVFGYLGTLERGKGIALCVGAFFFFLVAFPFVVVTNPASWGWKSLIFIFFCHGVGRSTFEGTLRSVFADMFSREKEGAFANIVLQNGLTTTIGFFIAACVKSPLLLELCVMVTSVLGVLGYWRAEAIFNAEQRIISTPLI